MPNPRIISEKCKQYGKKSYNRSNYSNCQCFPMDSDKIQYDDPPSNNENCYRNKLRSSSKQKNHSILNISTKSQVVFKA